jgi:hypothetical protein
MPNGAPSGSAPDTVSLQQSEAAIGGRCDRLSTLIDQLGITDPLIQLFT